MPLDTEFYPFDEEIERLTELMQETAESLAPLDPDNPMAVPLEQSGVQLESQVEGLQWARDEWDVDGVTLGGLTGGEYGYVEDSVDAGQQGKARVYMVAKGTVRAPYVDDEMSEDERVAATADLPIGYLRWADARINELMGVEGNDSPRFGDLLAEARQQQTTSTEE